MKKHWLRGMLLGVSLALLLPALAYAQGEILYGCNGANNPSNLYVIDPSTGAATLVGPMGMTSCSGLAFAADGALYAVGHDPDNPNDWFSLFVVEPATAAATPIGESHHTFGGVDSSRIADVSFRSDGRLFGYLEGEDGLGYLNTATGDVTELGPTNVECCGNGIAFSAGDVLFHANDVALHTLNQTTGNATKVADLIWPAYTVEECPSLEVEKVRINALDFSSGGVLYGSLNCAVGGSGPNYLVTVNTANGVVTEVGATLDGLDGIAFLPPPAEAEFVPEPGTLMLLGSGLMGLAGYATLRRRTRE